jgi:MFS transporter, DHA2 family, multidrug resistance protein
MITRIASQSVAAAPPDVGLARHHFGAGLAIFLVLITVYQTLVLTVVTDDVIRKGIEADEYDMIWVNVAWVVAILYSLLGAFGLAGRYGMRITLAWGLLFFAIGNLMCGAATDLTSMIVARFVEGIGKGLTIAIGRATLYKQFDRKLLIAIGFYGVCAYATRPSTPFVTAYINEWLSWRWIYWVNVPIAFVGIIAVLRYLRPDRPAKSAHAHVDLLAITTFVVWIVCLLFVFSWYRKWGGWSSNEFTTLASLCIVLPIALAIWLGSGFSPDEHLKRLMGSRVYVLAMMVRLLLLLNLAAVLSIIGQYMIELRDDPRVVAGWVMIPASFGMATTTLLTTIFHRRSLRHMWLFVGVLGTSACLWWLSSRDNFTAKEQVALILACWGLFIGLFPPVFLTDEVEGVNPKDRLYASSLALVGLIVPLAVVPSMTATAIKAWSDRALDVYRADLSENRPAVVNTSERIADYYRQRGLAGADLQRQTSTVLGTFATVESVAVGFQHGFRFLSVVVLGLGLAVAILLARASRDLRAPPGAGYL